MHQELDLDPLFFPIISKQYIQQFYHVPALICVIGGKKMFRAIRLAICFSKSNCPAASIRTFLSIAITVHITLDRQKRDTILKIPDDQSS